MKYFPSGKAAFFTHEVPAFHNIEGKFTYGPLNWKWRKGFGHGIKLLIVFY
jgi:hypothetical protein